MGFSLRRKAGAILLVSLQRKPSQTIRAACSAAHCRYQANQLKGAHPRP